jgi:uncharacterized membrane protein YozB (DUF420 family)
MPHIGPIYWPFQIQSICIFVLMVVGIFLHRKRSVHMKILSLAMLWDILLILQIELSRDAINKASKVLYNPLILTIHVSLAILTVILYGIMIYLGVQGLNGKTKELSFHRKLGKVTVFIRLLTLVTSFFAPR